MGGAEGGEEGARDPLKKLLQETGCDEYFRLKHPSPVGQGPGQVSVQSRKHYR